MESPALKVLRGQLRRVVPAIRCAPVGRTEEDRHAPDRAGSYRGVVVTAFAELFVTSVLAIAREGLLDPRCERFLLAVLR